MGLFVLMSGNEDCNQGHFIFPQGKYDKQSENVGTVTANYSEEFF
jgi:hypothetical protein